MCSDTIDEFVSWLRTHDWASSRRTWVILEFAFDTVLCAGIMMGKTNGAASAVMGNLTHLFPTLFCSDCHPWKQGESVSTLIQQSLSSQRAFETVLLRATIQRWRNGQALLSDDALPDAPSTGYMEGDGIHENFIKQLKDYNPQNPADIALGASLIGLEARESARVVQEQAATRYHHRYLHQEPAFTASVFAVVQWIRRNGEKHADTPMPQRALRSASEEGLMRLVHRAHLRYGGHKGIPNREQQVWHAARPACDASSNVLADVSDNALADNALPKTHTI